MMPKTAAALLLTLSTLIVCVGSIRAEDEDPPTLLAIFAHADDETVVMPLLARYARQGARVFLAIATDGRKGVNSDAKIPAGEHLARIRGDEARCSARQLGIRPPILLGLEDGRLAEPKSLSALHEAVARLFDELKPDAVITWGPGGGSGHPDHRMVSNVVTEIVQQGGREPGPPLFYVAFPSDAVESLPPFSSQIARWQSRNLRPTHLRHLPVRITYTSKDRLATEQALACHRSQFTPQAAGEILQLLDHLWNGTVYLRPWNGGASASDIF